MRALKTSTVRAHAVAKATSGLGLLCLALLLGACLEQRMAEVLPEPTSALCEAVPARTLDEVYAAHFASAQPTGCIAGCHEGGAGGLTFRNARELWQASVRKPSVGAPALALVEPGWPEHSHLYLKLLPDAAGRMPVGGPFLTDAALRDVAGWICAGAPEPSAAQPLPDGGTSTPDGGSDTSDGGSGTPDGGGTSPPLPTLTGLSPSSVATQGAPFTLTLTGTGFVPTSVVVFNGADVATTYVSDTTLEAQVPTLTVAGSYPVSVRTPAPGGGTSDGLVLTAVDSSAPGITGLEPASVAENTAFLLVVTGSGYGCTAGERSTVLFNSASYTPSACTSNRLEVSLPGTPAGSYPVQVRNANGESSNTLALQVSAPNPVPTLGALSPSQGERGGTGLTLRATGTGFVQGATLRFNGGARSTTWVSPTEVTAALPSTDLATAGSFPVVVANPPPGGGESNALDFTVVEPHPVPAISSLSPCGLVAGAEDFTLFVYGTGFVQGASVTFQGSTVPVTYVGPGELRATIASSLVGSAPADNAARVVVTNPAPGGGASNTAHFGVATRAVTLASDVQPIFTASCASSGCHGTSTSPILTDGRSYDSLVNKPSGSCAPRLLVLACGPLRSQSVLLDKVLATRDNPACSGSPMPKAAPLPAAQLQTLIDWVAQGAPR